MTINTINIKSNIRLYNTVYNKYVITCTVYLDDAKIKQNKMFGLWFIQSIWFLCTEMPFRTRLAVYRMYHSRFFQRFLFDYHMVPWKSRQNDGKIRERSYDSRKWWYPDYLKKVLRKAYYWWFILFYTMWFLKMMIIPRYLC